MARHELTDNQWQQVENLLPRNGDRGGQWQDHRRVLNGMLWRLCTGCPWRDLPARYGPWQTIYDRFNRWCRDDTLRRISQILRAELDRQGGIDWTLWCIDGSVVRAHGAAAGASAESQKKDRKNQPTMR
jgi:transposase